MKIFITICCFMTLPLWSQNHSISFLPRYGVSTNSFQLADPAGGHRYDYLNVQPYNDIGLKLDYQYALWKRFKIFLSTGMDLSKSTHYQQITERSYRIHLDNIILKKYRLGFHLGIVKQFSLIDDRLKLDLGGALIYRQFFNETKNYSEGFQFNNEDWIEYSYSLTTYHGKWYDNNLERSYNGRFGTELSGLLKYKINSQSYLNFGLSYITRNTFFYDYKYTVRYYLNDSSTPTSTIHNLGFIDVKYGSTDNYLYLNFGYTFVFKNKHD